MLKTNLKSMSREMRNIIFFYFPPFQSLDYLKQENRIIQLFSGNYIIKTVQEIDYEKVLLQLFCSATVNVSSTPKNLD